MKEDTDIWKKIRYNKNNLFLIGLLLLSTIIIRDFLAEVLNTLWVHPVMSNMYDSPLPYFLALSVILIFYYWISYKDERYISKHRVYTLLSLSVIYLLCLLYSKLESGMGWDFASIIVGSNNILNSYTTLIFIIPLTGELLLCLKRRKIQSTEDKECSLIFEKPIENVGDDSYKRENYAKIAANKINNNFHREGAFVTGISGSWGFGKTSFLNLVKSNIDSEAFDIIIDFKPWLSSSLSNIIVDFLYELSKEMNVYIPSFKNKLHEYAEAVSDINESSIIKIGSNIIRQGLSQSAGDGYNDISNKLKKSKLKVLVFIDDTDRLSQDEILEVFKLMRNTANFPYLQFLITYDRDYILKTLNIANPEKYIEKIFNMEISLPSFNSSLIRESLAMEIKQYLTINTQDKKTIVDFIRNKDDDFPIEKIIKTRRDVIRFTNSLIINVEALESSLIESSLDDINIIDLVKLELIRYRYPIFYKNLMLEPLAMLEVFGDDYEFFRYKQRNIEEATSNINKNTDSKLENAIDFFNDSHIIKDQINKYINDKDVLDVCMNNLFPQIIKKDITSVSMIRSFQQYFCYRYDVNNISVTEIIELLRENDKSKQIGKLEEFYSIKNPREIFHMIERVVSKFDDESWRKDDESPFYYENVLSLIRTSLESDNFKLKKEVITGCASIFGAYHYFTIEYYLTFLKLWDMTLELNILENESIFTGFIFKNNLQLKLRRVLQEDDKHKIKSLLENSSCMIQMSNLLNNYTDPEFATPNLILSKSELKEIQLLYFLKYAQNKKIDETCRQLYQNSAHIDSNTRGYSWDEVASVKMRELVDIDPQGYITMFVVMDNFYVYPPAFWKSIFKNDAKAMESYLYSKEKNNLNGIDNAKTAWEIYKYNDYKQVEINNFPVDKLSKEALLLQIKSKLDILLQIEREIEQLREETKTTVNLEQFANKQSSIKLRWIELQNRLNSVDLYIKLNGVLDREINSQLAK